MTYDAIVIGVGGMGSAIVYHLARQGARVLGIERFDIPHDRGSSHGRSRIIRLAYWEHPDYVPLVRRAYDLWRDLERTSGESLLTVTGSIDAGPPDSRMIRGALAACQRHGLEHELLDAAALTARFPGYRLPDGLVAVFQPDGGFLHPEHCIVAHVNAARALGATVQTQERAIEWTAEDDRVRVTTDRGRYEAAKLVISAGPWLPAVVPALALRLTVERQVVLWTQPLRPELFTQNFPVFYIDTPRGAFYGFPADAQLGFKIGKYHHRRQSDRPRRVGPHVLGRRRSGAPRGALALFSGRERSQAFRISLPVYEHAGRTLRDRPSARSSAGRGGRRILGAWLQVLQRRRRDGGQSGAERDGASNGSVRYRLGWSAPQVRLKPDTTDDAFQSDVQSERR